jgi:hypothetical protein
MRWSGGLVGMALVVACAAPASAQLLEAESDGKSLRIEIKAQVYVESTDFGSGMDRQSRRTDIHFQRLRITATGMLNDVWGVKFQTCGNCGTSKQGGLGYGVTAQDVDWNDRDVRIIDGYGIANFHEALNFKIGLTKIPLTRANLDDCYGPLSLDRSMFVYSAYGSSPAKFSRDLGIVAWGTVADNKLGYFGGMFQGREGMTRTTHPFSGAIVTSTIEPQSSFEWVGRVHYSLLDPEAGSGYMGSYLGEYKILTVGVGAAFEPSVAYKNVNPNGSLRDMAAVDYSALAADVMFEYPTTAGTPTVQGQYLKTDFEDAYKTNFNVGDRLANIAGLNGQKEGGYVKAAYILPVTIKETGLLQPYGVYEDWKFAHLLGIDDQQINQYGGGLNYYLKGQNVRFTAEYLRTDFDKMTPLIGSRMDPVTSMPIDRWKSYDTFRVMFQFVY